MNAFVAKWGSVWLVGECEIIDIDLENPTTTTFIENNRYSQKNIQSMKSNILASENKNRTIKEPITAFSSILQSAQKQQHKPPETVGKNQGLLVKRCKFLEESGCASACVNSCKIPTQNFFKNDMNLPVTMTPNYETYECIFEFGKAPTTDNLSDAMDTPCLSRCPSYGKLRSLHNKGATAAVEEKNSFLSSEKALSASSNNENEKQNGKTEQKLSQCHSMYDESEITP